MPKQFYKLYDLWVCWHCGRVEKTAKDQTDERLFCKCHPEGIIAMDKARPPDAPNQVTLIKSGRPGR